VALLRGINVGGNNKVSMSELKKVFESLGYSSVKTYINSGNVIFEEQKKEEAILAREIEKALEKTFKFRIKIVLRDSKNIQKLNKAIPSSWQNNSDMKTDVLFLWGEFDTKATLALLKTNLAVDTLQYISGAIVWSVLRKNYAKSGMNKFIGTLVYKNMTARNVNTVRKMEELLRLN
jgi:uncharacterized protein (DUF1697 family)